MNLSERLIIVLYKIFKDYFICLSIKNMLSEIEMCSIIKNFPRIELSYETFVHKKVHNADIIFAIPEGKKCFAWFTTYKEENVCLLLETRNNKEIVNINICNVGFHDILSCGTILSGTSFQYNNNNCFSIDDIHFFKGEIVDKFKTPFINKLSMIHSIFKNYISQKVIFYSKKNLIFGMPIFCKKNEFNNLLNDIATLPYKIKTFRFHCFNNPYKTFIMNYYKPGSQYHLESNVSIKNANFKITPDIQNDIYYLHVYNNNQFEHYDIAYIPDYKTSVLMNKLFRNIKENNNLDLLEESDDEEEFENNNLDKFVYLNKSFNMKCVFNLKFKKWVPISLANKHDKVVTKNQLL